jgi:arylformamidase
MPVYDISLSISPSLVVWPGHPPIGVTQTSHLARGDRSTVSRLELSSHIGTHVDAPAHFVPGASGVDAMDLGLLVGQTLVVHCLGVDAIKASVLDGLAIPPGTERVLFRTRNSDLWARGEKRFDQDYVAVTRDGAQWLIEHGVRLVGVDYLAVAPCLPLKIEGGDGAPARAILIGG